MRLSSQSLSHGFSAVLAAGCLCSFMSPVAAQSLLDGFEMKPIMEVSAFAVMPDGRIAVGGWQRNAANTDRHGNVRMLWGSGQDDTSYPQWFTSINRWEADSIGALQALDDGSLLVGGDFSYWQNDYAPWLIKLTSRGQLDQFSKRMSKKALYFLESW